MVWCWESTVLCSESTVWVSCSIRAWQPSRSAGIVRRSAASWRAASFWFAASLTPITVARAVPGGDTFSKVRDFTRRRGNGSRRAAVAFASLHPDQRHTGQQHGQLCRVDLLVLALRVDHFECPRFQKSVIEPIAGAVEVQDFEPVAPAVDEEE